MIKIEEQGIFDTPKSRRVKVKNRLEFIIFYYRLKTVQTLFY